MTPSLSSLSSSSSRQDKYLLSHLVHQVIEVEPDHNTSLDSDEGDELSDEMCEKPNEDVASTCLFEPSSDIEHIDAQVTFTGHTESVYCVRAHDLLAVSGDGADLAYLWSTQDGALQHVLRGHTDSVSCCDISADGALALTASLDCTVRVWRGADGALLYTLSEPSGEIEWARFHPTGPAIAAGDSHGMVWLWSAQTGQLIHPLVGLDSSCTVGTFSSDGRFVLCGDANGSIYSFSGKTGLIQHKWFKLHDAGVTSINIQSRLFSSQLVLSGSENGAIGLVNAENGRLLHKIENAHQDSVEGVAFSHNNALRLYASGSVDTCAHIWDLDSAQKRVTLHHDDAVTSLCFIGDQDNVLVTGCADGIVRIWDTRSGELIRALRAHNQPILCMTAVHSQTISRRVATGGDDGFARIFSLD